MKKTFLRNPKGSRDWLPNEVIKQEFVRRSLVKVFELWGYRPIQTPILISWDTLSQGSSKLADVAFKLMGEHGELLALRADLTTPIARVTAERMQKEKLPFRFYYVGKVFRYHARKTTNERELYQVGIELIGSKEGISDLECLQVLLDSLSKLKLKKYLVLFNHSTLWVELFKCFGNIAQELYKALSKKDLILFNLILSKSKLSNKEKEFWSRLIQVRGNKDAIKEIKQLAKLVKRLKIKKIISYFEKILNLFENNIEIDLSLTSDVDYYTGIYFEVITPFLGRNIGSGGRYDELISKFGFNTPAIGFSFCLEDLLLTLENQSHKFLDFKPPELIAKGRNIKNTFKAIKKLHSRNKNATIKI
ncbi:MAG: ATP phosphoribosyltransferase regulatory subunit [Candidatus Melainabacteria bacterium]|nr:ATP phosphoribosyltransferase regulatory subunit [Candidatus Melainabacteria bacterium]